MHLASAGFPSLSGLWVTLMREVNLEAKPPPPWGVQRVLKYHLKQNRVTI